MTRIASGPGRWILIVFALVAGVASALAYFGGYVSPDGSHYLALADRVVSTGSLTHVPLHGDGQPVPFTIWPLGYPLFVAGAAWVTGLPAIAASKLLSLALLAAALACVWRMFGTDLRVLAPAVFLLPSGVRIFTYSYSEQLFIVAVFASLLVFTAMQRRGALWPLLAAAMSLAFLARYIGIVVPVGIVAATFLTRPPHWRRVLLACAVALVIDGLYLGGNVLLAGRATGVERIPAPESLAVLAVGFTRALVLDAAPYVLVLGLAAATVRRAGLRGLAGLRGFAARNRAALACVVVGAVYLGALFALRSVRHFDFFNPRLTFPGTVLLLVGAAQLCRAPRWMRTATLAATCIYLALWTGRHARNVDPDVDSGDRLATAAGAYADVPLDAVLVLPASGDSHLQVPQRLVRPDLVLIAPKHAPYHRPESGAAFARRLERIGVANPGSTCWLDFTAFATRAEMTRSLLKGGLTPELVARVGGHFVPNVATQVRGCRLARPPAATAIKVAARFTR